MNESQNTQQKEQRLWLVTVEYELIVVAYDEREAELEGKRFAGEDGSGPPLVTAHPVSNVDEIPSEWRMSIPFGGDEDDQRECVYRVS